MKNKKLYEQYENDKCGEPQHNEISWSCRFHPIDSYHEVGCPHQTWSLEDLHSALITKKRFEQIQGIHFYEKQKIIKGLS